MAAYGPQVSHSDAAAVGAWGLIQDFTAALWAWFVKWWKINKSAADKLTDIKFHSNVGYKHASALMSVCRNMLAPISKQDGNFIAVYELRSKERQIICWYSTTRVHTSSPPRWSKVRPLAEQNGKDREGITPLLGNFKQGKIGIAHHLSSS